jgi:hypothetical protein
MPVRCVEPALAVMGDPNNTFLVNVAAGTELLFPHVDSCMAIAMLLVDGRIIGGHVSMQLPVANAPLDPLGNATAMLLQMNVLRGVTAVSKLVLVGDANWENDFVTGTNIIRQITISVGCADRLHVDTGNYGGGVDVSFNPRRSLVFITRCTGGHAIVLNRTYAMIVGHQRV